MYNEKSQAKSDFRKVVTENKHKKKIKQKKFNQAL